MKKTNCLNIQSIKKEESEIIINSVVSVTGRTYGSIYYDTDKDGIFYKNANGDIESITGNKNRDIKPIFNNTTLEKSRHIYRGKLAVNTLYKTNDIIKHDGTLYICNSSHINKVDNIDEKKWDILINKRPTVEVWNPHKSYEYGDIVINEDKLYIREDNDNDNDIEGLDDMTGWKLIFSCNCKQNKQNKQNVDRDSKSYSESINNVDSSSTLDDIDELVDGGIFFAFFTNGSCCFSYMNSVGKSRYDFRCEHKSIEESEIWKDQEIVVLEKSKINIPMNFILKNSCDGVMFDDDEKGIIITKSGYYRLTYNISYYGSIYAVTSKIILVNTDAEGTCAELIPHSINKSVNRYDPINLYDDKLLDAYYEDIKNVDENIRYINHTCPIYVDIKKFNVCKIVLIMDFTDRNISKKIYLCPLKTWLNIEKI